MHDNGDNSGAGDSPISLSHPTLNQTRKERSGVCENSSVQLLNTLLPIFLLHRTVAEWCMQLTLLPEVLGSLPSVQVALAVAYNTTSKLLYGFYNIKSCFGLIILIINVVNK